MRKPNFSTTLEVLRRRVEKTDSLLCVGLDLGPHTAHLLSDAHPTPEALNGYLVDQTHPFAAAYKFQLAGYLALGEAGMPSLKNSIDHIRQTCPDMPIILDGKFSDIAVSLENYAVFAFDHLGVDAVTANPLLGMDANQTLLERTDRLIYFLCSTTNPGSAEFQEFGTPGPLYVEIASRVNRWNTSGNCGLVVGATHPDRILAIRGAAPDLPFLTPGLGAQGGDLERFLPPALTQGRGSVLINVSRAIITADAPHEAAESFARQIAQAAQQKSKSKPTRREKTIALLTRAGCIQHGTFTLASGETSNIYFDLRLLSSHPTILSAIARQLHALTQNIAYDVIATIPTGGLPLATALSLISHKPLVYVRKEPKQYGFQKQIEGGELQPGQRVLLVDDVITTGGSKVNAIEAIRELGAHVTDIAVIVDRRDTPGEDFLNASVHPLLTLTDLVADAL